MMIVAIMTVRRSELATFRAFESIAVAAMRTHGGHLERTVVVDEGNEEHVQEIHLVRFDDEHGFEGYKADARVAAATHLRDRAVVATQLFIGTEGRAY